MTAKKIFIMTALCALLSGFAFISADTEAAAMQVRRTQLIVHKNTKVNLVTKGVGGVKSSKLSFKVKKKSVARVNKSGILSAKKTGETKVTVNNKADKTKAVINIKVIGSPAEYTIKKGKTASINTILSSNAKNADKKSSSYTWTSRNSKIAKVVNGQKSVKGRKKGTTYLIGSKGKEERIALKITVGTPVKQINLSQTQYIIGVGAKAKVGYTTTPSKVSNDKFYYELSKKGIITISSSGKITAKKSGEVTVTMKSADGRAKAVFSVIVVAELTRNTAYGKVEGTVVNSSCIAWFGVPYAKPPVGELRWRAPQELDSWSGVLSTKEKKSKAAQAETTTTSSGSEDCLYLNIYRPNTDDSNLPVMVFLHGGSNISGSATRSFKNFAAATNTIVVAVEYRLGAFGWLNLDALKTGNAEEDSGNFALLDIKKSLQWVRSNISSFGGNANNVTLSGFSAGARNALACIISPVTRGMFDKAIIFSGGMTTFDPQKAQESAEQKLAAILVRRGTFPNKKNALSWLDTASKEEVKSFLYSLTKDEVACMYTYMGLKLSNAPQLFADGYVIPADGFAAVQRGDYNAVPMILGSSSQEFATYALSANYSSAELSADITKKGWNMIAMIQNAKRFGSMFQSCYYIEHNAETFLASGRQPSIYAYRFDWGNDPDVSSDFFADFLGSYHGLDVSFLCGSYKNEHEAYVSDLYNAGNHEGRKTLTSVMQNYVANFMKTGNPNGNGLASWNAWNNLPGSRIMVFDASKTANASYMSPMYYRREDIDNLMKSTLSIAQCDILNKLVFAGRYFMPEDETTLVPDEDSDDMVEGTTDLEASEVSEVD